MKPNGAKGFKSDSSIRDKEIKESESNIRHILELYLEGISSWDFWPGAKKIRFTDDWTCSTQKLLSDGGRIHGLKHRLALDEEDDEDLEVSR